MNDLDKGDFADKFSDFYIYISTLGSGSFGKVVHALNRTTRQEIAVKVIEKHTVKPGRISELKKESEILSSLNHPNIVQFIHLKETEKRIFLVMELVSHGNLQEFIQINRLSELQASQIMTGILRAVDYMHSKNVIHRDIKPENILLASLDDLTSVKVTDFGLSSQYDQSIKHHMESQNCGTLKYMAPEQTGHRFYSQSVDIWSCGIMMFTLIAGEHPLEKPNETKNSYIEKLKNPKWKFPNDFSHSAKSLFLKLVEMAPIERYSASQALNHPWILRQEVKAPLTAFEKFKVYGEHLKFKGIIYPIFFTAIINEKSLLEQSCASNKEEVSKKPPLPSPVKKGKKEFIRGMTTPSPDLLIAKRGNRFISPAASVNISRKLTPKESIKMKLSLRKKAKSFDKV